jgi:hypothetical protein
VVFGFCGVTSFFPDDTIDGIPQRLIIREVNAKIHPIAL